LDAQRTPDGSVRLVVVAPAAATVELAGDFTDWQPVQLRRNAAGTWETVRKIPSGVYRFNVRIDGSGWFAPAGTARATDDFGGERSREHQAHGERAGPRQRHRGARDQRSTPAVGVPPAEPAP